MLVSCGWQNRLRDCLWVSEDLRIQKFKQAIKNAFLSLLAEKDFEKITIKDICTQAMIGKSTFYYHYEDKYDLARQLAIQSLKNYQQHVLIPRLKKLDHSINDLINQIKQSADTALLMRKIQTPEINVEKMLKEQLAKSLQPFIVKLGFKNQSALLASMVAALLMEILDADETDQLELSQTNLLSLLNQLQHILQNLT